MNGMRYIVGAVLVLVVFCLVACGGGGSSSEDDLTPPEVALDAVSPSTFEGDKMLSGTVEPGATVEITVEPDADVGAVTVEGGMWQCLLGDLEPGLSLVTVTAEDRAGNTASMQFYLTYELARIDQVITITPQQTLEVRGSLAPGGSIEAVRLNDEELSVAPVVTGSQWTFTIPAIPGFVEGGNILEIEAWEEGDSDRELETSVTIYSYEDAVSLAIDPPQVYTDSDSLVLSGTMSEGADIVVEVGDEAIVGDVFYDETDTIWQVEVKNLSEGQNTLTVTATHGLMETATGWTRITLDRLPEVEGTLPVDGATAVLQDSALMAIFSEPMRGTSINTQTFLVEGAGREPVDGMVTYEADEQSALFEPSEPLAPGTVYTVTLTEDITDPSGNPIVPFTWTFSTL